MPNNLSLGRFLLAWAGLVLMATSLQGQGPARAATLRVWLMADTQLVSDDHQTQQTGPLRRFVSPPLELGKSYHYTLKWTYRKDGNPVTQKKVVFIRAGDDAEV
jgi:uncharacterized protein (TIGR03000 family)